VDSDTTNLLRFVAASPEDVSDVCAIIHEHELELVYVEFFAAPKDAVHAGELLLVFGESATAPGCAE